MHAYANAVVVTIVAAAVLYAVVRRRVDARLALAAGALALCAIQVTFAPFERALPLRHSDDPSREVIGVSWNALSAWLVTICGFGFAAVLKSGNTVKGLTRVISRIVGWNKQGSTTLIAAIGVVASFVASLLLLSANSACAIVGPIVAPILSSFGVSPEWAGGCIVAGAWGAVLNIGDGNVSVIKSALGQCKGHPHYSIAQNLLPALAGLIVAVGVLAFSKSARRAVAGHPVESGAESLVDGSQTKRWHWPLVPLALILLVPLFIDREQAALRNTMFALSFVLAGAVAVSTSTLATVDGSRSFAKGMLKAVLDVVVLILASKFLAESVKLYIDADRVVAALKLVPAGIYLVLPMLTALFAAVTGSGDAAIAFTANYMLRAVDKADAGDPLIVASLLFFAGEMGRCVSPTAAATKAVAGLEKIPAREIARHALRPVLAAGLVAGALLVATGSRQSEADPVLVFVNGARATPDLLSGSAGLERQSADAILAHRNGPDGVLGTSDDDPFDSIQELDAATPGTPSAGDRLRKFVGGG